MQPRASPGRGPRVLAVWEGTGHRPQKPPKRAKRALGFSGFPGTSTGGWTRGVGAPRERTREGPGGRGQTRAGPVWMLNRDLRGTWKLGEAATARMGPHDSSGREPHSKVGAAKAP
ncbi:hypothetical protein VTH82DRAFT_875 [Thermothelomyces myriococcoides]